MKKLVLFIACALVASSCAAFEAAIDDVNRSLRGVEATMTTYTQLGDPIDSVTAVSMQITRESEFDTTNSDGFSNSDSDVIRISVGDDIIRHVGSTMIVAETGIQQIADAPTRIELESNESGQPWLNNLYENFQNDWDGSAKTIMIRSQDGTPIAVYAGNSVEVFKTDVPKSTRFQVDGMFLFVYRADYTVYDTALLG